jgi:alkylation response protein AidB-like acyl-CoA dehydrogenase
VNPTVAAAERPAALPVELTVAAVRSAFGRWLEVHAAELAEFRHCDGDLEATFTTLSRLQRLLHDAGWIRLGWPEAFGGLGGSVVLRGVISEELAAAGYPPPFSFGTQEVLGPAVAEFAAPDLARAVLPRLLAGDETWCQGFSEPEAGSDLASLRLRADDDGDSFRLNGQKVWTSWAQFADRCVLLTRTGPPGSGHRGITALFVDMDSPGIMLRPLVSMTGDAEFCEMFFDDVIVPKSRVLGEVGGGWAVTMFVLASERGVAAWQRQAWITSRFADLVRSTAGLDAAAAGEALELVYALRLLSRRTMRALGDGVRPGPSASLDKLLMATTEQFLFDLALSARSDDIRFGTEPAAEAWRRDFLYSRAASIYGGTSEIQRTIIAERILGLPRGR